MSIIIGFLIFCLVLFFYIHIQFHLKTGEDLEMYEVDDISKENLEDICDLRQPVLFDFDCRKIMETTNRDCITNNYSAFDIKIRNVRENDKNTEHYMPLPLYSAVKLFNEDKSASYLTENNGDFLQETSIKKNIQYNDEFIRPYMMSNCNYDILMGSSQVCTPFRYEINYRNYFLLTQGSAQIKMTCPKNIKYLNPELDYENFEFSSPINVWNPQTSYQTDYDKIKFLEFTLLPGKTLYIPAYLAIINYIGLHFLQLQNVKRETVKKIDISKLNKHKPPTIIEETTIAKEDSTIDKEESTNINVLS